jgi:protein-disulfide isomerase
MEENTETIKKPKNNVGSAVIVAALIIGGSILYASTPKNNSNQSAQSNQISILDVSEEDFILGNKDAEITLVEYADFSCSFCARYHPIIQQIVKDYDGKVKWVYRHLPIFNKQASIASTCVGNILGNGKFFEYADVIYKNQSRANDDEFLKIQALSLGLEESEYNVCINSKEVSDKINREFSAARILAGINATPYSVLIDADGNKYPFSGALSYEEVSGLIDSIIR